MGRAEGAATDAANSTTPKDGREIIFAESNLTSDMPIPSCLFETFKRRSRECSICSLYHGTVRNATTSHARPRHRRPRRVAGYYEMMRAAVRHAETTGENQKKGLQNPGDRSGETSPAASGENRKEGQPSPGGESNPGPIHYE